ncbi:MAG: hypothetical protein ACYC2S_00295 [Spirochaetales bacterium]
MRGVHILDNLPAERSVARKRARVSATRNRLKVETAEDRKPANPGEPLSKKILIVVESEGAVFDSLARKHENGYLPAFAGCFSWGSDPSTCASLWRALALRSKLRGQDPRLILLSALRLLNRNSPSIRRAAVIRVLDLYLANPSRDPLGFAASPSGSPERLILDWMSMSNALLDAEGYPPEFGSAREFLRDLKTLAPRAELLVHSSLPEAVALNQWEMAGLGDSFLRIAGAERGNFAAYLRTALKNGYDADPILVIGTTGTAWQAAQSVGARFFPIVPGAEEQSWQNLSEVFFPAFMRGESAFIDRDSRSFMRMMLDDIESTIASDA